MSSVQDTLKYENFNYKKHIDGIKAFILLVIFTHVYPELIPGGWVNIFFVITGYVITLIIFKEVYINGNFSLSSFYYKRFIRLFPPLIFVIISTFIFYCFFGYLGDFEKIFKSGLLSILGFANIYFIRIKAEYLFENYTNIYLHVWALSIIIQFLFIYPIILKIVFYFVDIKKILLNKISIFFLFTTILFSILFFYKSNSFYSDFYFISIRLWQFLLGSFLFFFTINFRSNNFIKIFTFIYSIFLVFFLNYIQNFNLKFDLQILSITIFTFLIFLSSNEDKNIFNKILSSYIFQVLGKLSFHLYLWHFSVLYFVNIYLSNKYFILFYIFFTVFFSFISFLFFEKKVFRIFKINFSILLFYFILLIAFVSIILLFSNSNKNLLNNFKNKVIEINYLENNYDLSNRLSINWQVGNNFIWENCSNKRNMYVQKKIIKECSSINDKDSLFILEGLSHAAHYSDTLNNSQYVNNLSYNYYNEADLFNNSKEKNKSETFFLNNLLKEYKSIYIFYSYRFKQIDKNLTNSLYKTLQNRFKLIDESINIILVTPTPSFNKNPIFCIMNDKNCKIDKLKYSNKINKINSTYKKLEKEFVNVKLLNFNNELCPNDYCAITNKNLIYYRDIHHLSIEGARYLGVFFDNWYFNNFIN